MRLQMRLWWTLPILLLCAIAGAQITLPQPGKGGPDEVPAELRSPQATMSSFLEAMEEGRGSDARATLDLSDVSVFAREEIGTERANQLWDAINRTRLVRLDQITDDPEAPEPYVFETYEEGGEPVGSIEIVRLSDGSWKFSAATIRALPAIWRSVQDQPLAAGARALDVQTLAPGLWMRERVPQEWQRDAGPLELWQWAFLAALLGAAFLILFLTRLILGITLRFRLQSWEQVVSDPCLRSLRRALGWFLVSWLWFSAYPFLDLGGLAEVVFIFVLKVLWVVTGAWLAMAFWGVMMDLFGARAKPGLKAEHILIPIARKFGQFVIVIAALVVFLGALDVNVAGVLAGLGIGGLVLALAAKDSVENVFGSLTILFDMPFGIGDWVVIGDIDGNVEEINLRSTKIRTFHDSLITLPNANLIRASVENYGARRYRRLKTYIGITYDTPAAKIEAFCEGIRNLIRTHPHTWKEKFHVHLHDLEESSLNVLLYMYFITPSYADEVAYRQEILTGVIKLAAELDVRFAFPSQSVYVEQSEPRRRAEESGPILDPGLTHLTGKPQIERMEGEKNED